MKPHIHFFMTAIWVLVEVFCPLSLLVAQQATAKSIKFPVEMKPFTLTIVDDKGQPVKGVTVATCLIRCKETPENRFAWPEENAPNVELTSDSSGKVELKYPAKFGGPNEWKTTTVIDLCLRHPDFIFTRAEFNVTDGHATHPFVAGCRAVFSCMDENGKVINKFGCVLARHGFPDTWRLKNNELHSNAINEGNWQTMLVAPSDDGVHLFSGVLPARYARGKDVTIRNVKLRPGMRLSGSLSDNVPRPVVEGKVIAWCLPKPAGTVWDRVNPTIGWCEETEITEDGSFEFLSLPRGGQVQLIAVSKGWLITGRERVFTVGKTIEVNKQQLADNRVNDITLEMSPTGSIEVEVLGPDGKPLVGATVSSWWYTKLNLCNLETIGDSHLTKPQIESQISGVPLDDSFSDPKPSTFKRKTDAHGKATLSGIPLQQLGELSVVLEGMRQKADKDQVPNQKIIFQCETVEPKKVIVHLEAATE